MVQDWLTKRGIHNYTTTSQVKAPSNFTSINLPNDEFSGVERAIRTLRNAVQRHFESTESYAWVDFLPSFVCSYNNRSHSTTHMKPLDLAVDPMLTAPPPKKPKRGKAILPKIGAFVRLNRLKDTFDKESSGGWTEEVFKVVRHKIHSSNIPMLWVEDLLGEPIRGAYYPLEVQEVVWDGVRKVDKVLQTRKRKGEPSEYLVSYYGWPKKFIEWTRAKP